MRSRSRARRDVFQITSYRCRCKDNPFSLIILSPSVEVRPGIGSPSSEDKRAVVNTHLECKALWKNIYLSILSRQQIDILTSWIRRSTECLSKVVRSSTANRTRANKTKPAKTYSSCLDSGWSSATSTVRKLSRSTPNGTSSEAMFQVPNCGLPIWTNILDNSNPKVAR